MNAKYAVALILALQVSMSLCEDPTPPAELVIKYKDLRDTLFSRLQNFFETVGKANVDDENIGPVKKGLATLRANPDYQAGKKVVFAMFKEMDDWMTKPRNTVLAFYNDNLRGLIGVHLDAAITKAKVYLDKYLPTP